MTLSIKDWRDTFENYRSRERTGPLQWIDVPTAQDGQAFRTLMSTAGGIQAFGVFIALCEVAGKMPVRGTLADDKGDLRVKSLSVRIGCAESAIRKALAVLMAPEIGWIIDCAPVKHPSDTRRAPVEHPSDTRRAPVEHPGNTESPALPCLALPCPAGIPGDARGAEIPPPTPPAAKSSPGVSTFVNARSHAAGRYPGFDRVCALYPPGMANGINAARNAWTAQDCEPVAAMIEAAIGAYTKCRKWREGFVPALSKFLTERLWEEAPPPDPPSPAELKREKGKTKWEAEKARLLAKAESEEGAKSQ